MKIKSVYVSSFGNLKNLSLDFTDGLNTVKEENGWGKSTLAAFIKCAFYGINDSKRSVADNERIKYRPWNSTEKFGGNVVFCRDGKTYRIERYFGNKQSEDTVRLFDDETGREFTNNKDLGNRLFDIDEEGFFSTTYLSQKDLEIKSNSSLTAKFDSNGESDAEESFEKALSSVETKKKRYKADRGGSGIIADLNAEIYRKDEELAAATQSAEVVSSLKTKLAELEKKGVELKNESDRFAGLLKESGRAEALGLKRENLKAYREELKETLDRKKSFDDILCGNNVTEEDLSACEEGVREVRALTARKTELESVIAEKPTVPVKRSVIKPILPFILAGLSLAFGIVSVFAINLIFGVALIALGAISAGIYAFIYFKDRRKNPRATGAIIDAEEDELKKIIGRIKDYTDGLETFFSRFDLGDGSFDLKLEKIRSAVLGGAEAKGKAEKLRIRIAELSEELERSSFSGERLDGIKIREDLKRTNDELNAVVGEVSRTRAQIGFNEERAERLSAIKEEKDEIAERLIQAKEEYEILSLTAEYLKKADENLKKKYRAPLQESLDKYISMLAGDRIKAAIDIDLKVSVVFGGRNFEVDYMSKGYKNLIDICKRFALVEVLFKKEKPFMILDDPFTNLDEDRIAAGAALLKKLSEEYQIIYLVCHDSRKI